MVASIAQWALCGVLLAALADLSVAIEDMEAMIVAATEPLLIVTELESSSTALHLFCCHAARCTAMRCCYHSCCGLQTTCVLLKRRQQACSVALSNCEL